MPATPDHRPSLDPESEDYKRRWAEGLRPHVIWLPDTKDPSYIAEAQRQARAIAASPEEKEDVDFVESISVSFDE